MTVEIPNRLTAWLSQAPRSLFAGYTIGVSFTTYFCMYAFRKPFVAGTYEDLPQFLAVDLKTALVIGQIVGYTLSKFIGVRVCSEVRDDRRGWLLVLLILWALAALVLFAIVPPYWKVAAIFLNGLPLGLVWGLVVRYLEGRQLSEFLLAGLSCSFILASGVVKDVGRAWMKMGVDEVWMPAITAACFLPPYLLSVWLLNQIPRPNEADVASRVERPPMMRRERIDFLRRFGVGLIMLMVVYLLLTAYRDFRDIYGIEILQALGYAEAPIIFTRIELPIAFGVLVVLAALNLVKDHWRGLLGAYVVVAAGLLLMGASTAALDAGLLRGREIWWMVLAGLGVYLAYVPFSTVLFERLIAATRFNGTAVFAIYIADSVGYTGSVVVQLYKDLAQAEVSHLDFVRHFTYLLTILGLVLLAGSCLFFVRMPQSSPQPSLEPEPAEA